jgi:predicted metalloenzyme YecM
MIPPEISSFLKQGTEFFENLLGAMARLGFEGKDLRADHLCHRVATSDEYEVLKNFLSKHAELLTETPVNGRLIASYRLHQPFTSSRGPIPLVELPAPKPGRPYPTGFEHAEFVIHESFASLMGRHTHLKFSPSEPKPLNCELGLGTPAGQAKFHQLSLERVIEIEEAAVQDVIFDLDEKHLHELNEVVENIRGLGFRVHLSPDDASKLYPSTATAPSVLVVSENWHDLRSSAPAGVIRAAALWDLLHDPLSDEGAELYFRDPAELAEYLNARAPKASQDS